MNWPQLMDDIEEGRKVPSQLSEDETAGLNTLWYARMLLKERLTEIAKSAEGTKIVELILPYVRELEELLIQVTERNYKRAFQEAQSITIAGISADDYIGRLTDDKLRVTRRIF